MPPPPGVVRAGAAEDPLSIITGPPPFAGAQQRRHSGIFLRILLLCGGLFFLSFIALIAVAAFSSSKHPSSGSGDATGKEAFEEASRSIGSNRDGVGHGNTPEAQKLAENLSELLGILGQKIPHMADQETLDSTHGKFIVYCQLNEADAAFLVHVPNLRHYTTESKHEIAKLCYVTACAVLKTSGKDSAIRKVAVATRGAILYDTALQGSYPAPKDKAAENLEKLEIDASDAPGMYSFFLAKMDAESASPETPPAPVASAASTPSTPAVTTTPEPSTRPLASTVPPPAETIPAASAPPTPRRPPADFNKPPPSWVPTYPGLARPPHGNSREENGIVKGRTNFDTTDPLDKIKDYYESKLKADGFEITETQPSGKLFEKAEIIGKRGDGKFSVRTEITQMKARTLVTVTFEGPENVDSAPAK